MEPDLTVYPTHRYCENSRKEPLEGTDQFQVAFFYLKGNDYVKPASTAGTGWPTITVNSTNCESLNSPNWVAQFICDLAIGASTNSSMLALLEANSDEESLVTLSHSELECIGRVQPTLVIWPTCEFVSGIATVLETRALYKTNN